MRSLSRIYSYLAVADRKLMMASWSTPVLSRDCSLKDLNCIPAVVNFCKWFNVSVTPSRLKRSSDQNSTTSKQR